MSLRETYVDGQVVVDVATIPEFEITQNLFGHMEDLREVMDTIPAQHRAQAKIEMRTWSDHGGYPDGALFISYARPATPEEIERERQKSIVEAGNKREWLRRTIVRTLEEAKADGIAPSELGITVDEWNYVVRR
jgi:hypothetical protein